MAGNASTRRWPIAVWSPFALLLMILLPMAASAVNRDRRQAPVGSPDLNVEYLGSERGFAVTGQTLTVLCVIRNVGAAPLPENAARVRCYPLAGLDFMDGQLWPIIPALDPNQAVAYRWRLALSDASTPLVFSVLITSAGRSATDRVAAASSPGPRVTPAKPDEVAPKIVSASIPRFPGDPHLLGLAKVSAVPQAGASQSGARVGNDRTLVSVVAAQDRVPLLAIAGKQGADWKTVAIVEPCIRVRSSEEGQSPWWESFRWYRSDTQQTKDAATLTLQGSVGPNWSAELILESRTDTSVVNGKVRLTAKRTVRLFGLELPRLLGVGPEAVPPGHADGSATLLGPDPSPLIDQDRLAASHTGALTFGLTWPANPPLNGWRYSRSSLGAAEFMPVLAAEWESDTRGDVILAGASVEAPFRFFVFGPSDTVRDAQRFLYP